MRRTFSVFLTVLLTSVLGLSLGAQRAAAATWIVDDAPQLDCPLAPYTSIQAAINAPTTMPGDTIQVCPGMYAEQVQITKTLTINGAKMGVDARSRPFVAANESIIDHPCGPVQIMANNVVLDGFTVQGSTLSDPCFLAGIWTNPAYSGTQGGHQILNNIVQNNISGIEFSSNCPTPSLVQFNLIQNNNNPGPGGGNGIQSSFGLCNGTIDRNKFIGHANAAVLIGTSAPASNLTISNNELVGGTPGARFAVGNVTTANFVGNTSTGSTAANGPIRLFGVNSNVTINSNTLHNGVRGIKVSGTNSGIAAHCNSIQGNSVAGMDVDSGAYTGILDAENNWWGDSTGPTITSNPGGTGDAIIDPDGVVDYMPFLTSPPGTPCPPLPPPPPTGGPKDLVAGTGTINGFGDPVVHVNASRNRNTSAVTGRFYIRYPSDNFEVAGRVTCLTVSGNMAGVGGVIERVKGTPPTIFGTIQPSKEVLITVLDMGSPGTLDRVNEGQSSGASTVCPETGGTLAIKQGNYVVKGDPPVALLSSLDAMLAEFEAAAGCSSSIVCSGTGEFVLP
jgi:nitrous oxidase accessory protein NosD